jgi:hypothetical protein
MHRTDRVGLAAGRSAQAAYGAHKFLWLSTASAAFLAMVMSGNAEARCSDWLRNVALPKIGCSAHSIKQICAGLRPVPTNGSCPDVPVGAPAVSAAATLYQNFEALATRSGIDLSAHPTYTEAYFDERTQLFCSLLRDGNMVELMREVSFPPVVHFGETTQDRPRLEVAIMITGVPARCPDQTQRMRAFVGSVMR